MREINRIIVIVLCLLPLANCGSPRVVQAQGGFSNATLSGPYAFRFAGVENSGFRVAAVGRVTLDGAGRITNGSERRTEEGGTEFVLALTGSYTVSTDGTGTLTMNLSGGGADTWAAVIAAGGQRVKLVSIQPNSFLFGAVDGEMEKQ